MNLSGGNTVTLESGTLEGTGWTAVIRVASGDSFYMSGGIVRQTQSNATYVVMVNAGGTANAVSYTHLDVYKRQGQYSGRSA